MVADGERSWCLTSCLGFLFFERFRYYSNADSDFVSYRWDPASVWLCGFLIGCRAILCFGSCLHYCFTLWFLLRSCCFYLLDLVPPCLSHLVERSCQCLWWSAPPWLVHLLVITSSLVPLQILGTYLISEISQHSEIQLFGLQLKKQTCKMTHNVV